MINIEFEDEADINGEAESIEVEAEGQVDHDMNVSELKITSIYSNGLKRSFKLNELNFNDVKRITEKAKEEIIKKYDEEGYENAIEFDENEFFTSDDDDNEVERIVSKKEYYQH